MVERYKDVIKHYFKNHSLVESNLQSFDNFLDKGLQEIVDANKEIIPTVIPNEINDLKIMLGKVKVGKPRITEADGSHKDVYPMEARLRKLTYSAPIELDVSTIVDGVEREAFTTEIGKVPIMVRSKHCHLHGLNHDQLVEKYEDPTDPGGYFVLNGNERVLITVEDLASNKLLIEKQKVGPSKFTAKIFSEEGSFRIPHLIEQMKDGVMYLSFTRFKRVPIVLVIKALGFVKDQDIAGLISETEQFDDVFINLYENVDIKTQDEALETLAKKIGIVQKEEMIERVTGLLDRYLLPHLGTDTEDRKMKAYNLCKYIRRFLLVITNNLKLEDKDHLMNKRLKLSGDVLGDLFRVNVKSLVQDIMYNFQRLVKRGKFHSSKIIIRDQLLTSRVKSALATGIWVGGRKGISQNMDRTNFTATISHLQRVVSLLSATQENFEARALHPTHWGRLGPIETPEGTPIGLRKNKAMMAKVTQGSYVEDKLKKQLEGLGLKW
jgi:DNA-directed RNA polymerase beta subunit